MAFINGNALKNHLIGTGFADYMDGGAGDDTMGGGLGQDTLYGGAGNDWVQGNEGNDQLYGDAGNDTLRGDEGNDWLDGGTGADNMAGGINDDTYVVDNAGDLVIEAKNEGIDTVRVSISSYALHNNAENMVYTGLDDFAGTGNAERNQITGGIGDDTLVGGGLGGDTLKGGLGDDVLVGSGGHWADLLVGGAGNDTLNAAPRFSFSQAEDTLVGGAGDDTYYITGGASAYVEAASYEANGGAPVLGRMAFVEKVVEARAEGTDTVVLGTGFFDLTNVDFSKANVTASTNVQIADSFVPSWMQEGRVAGTLADLYANVENLRIETPADVYAGDMPIIAAGNDLDNVITGGDHAQLRQMLRAGGGNDTVFGGAGRDLLYGEEGNDQIHASGGNDVVFGGAGNDTLLGDAGDDQLRGGKGDDVLGGGAGNDYLHGGEGNDQLHGNAGDDILFGFSGADQMTGGIGADLFQFDHSAKGSQSVITDFQRGADHIVIEAGTIQPDGTVQFLAGGPAANMAWQVVTDAGLRILADTDGDAAADIDVMVNFATGGVAPLTNADFQYWYGGDALF